MTEYERKSNFTKGLETLAGQQVLLRLRENDLLVASSIEMLKTLRAFFSHDSEEKNAVHAVNCNVFTGRFF